MNRVRRFLESAWLKLLDANQDDLLSESERREIKALEDEDSRITNRVADSYQGVPDHEDGSPAWLDEAHRETAGIRRRRRRIEASPWIRLANEFGVHVPGLTDEEGEPDDLEFDKLKRSVRKARQREARQVLETRLLKSGFWVGLATLVLTGVSFYAQSVFQRDYATISFNPLRHDGESIVFSGVLANPGTRPVAVSSIQLSIDGADGKGVGLAGSHHDREKESRFPTILQPGALEFFSVARGFDLRVIREWNDVGERVLQKTTEKDRMALDFRAAIDFQTGSGAFASHSFSIGRLLFSTDGMIVGGAPPSAFGLNRPHAFVDRWRWFGPLTQDEHAREGFFVAPR